MGSRYAFNVRISRSAGLLAGYLIILCVAGGSMISSARAQQVVVGSGATFVNNGANIVVNANVVNSGTINNTATGTIKLTGNWQNDGTYSPTGCTVTFSGSSAQTISGSNTTTFENFILNNSNGITLSKNITVNSGLTFTSGKITTGANSLILGSSAAVSGAGSGKYVYGNLQWTLPSSGSPSRTFYIGDAGNYTPIMVDFMSLTAGGTVTGSTTAGAHPQGTTSGISGVKRVNRYWTLTNNGATYASCDPTFSFVSGDVLGGANTANFIIKEWTGATWNSTTVDTRTSVTTKITGVTTSGDFLDGEAGNGCVQSLPPDLATATSSTICQGYSTLLSLSGGGGGTYETVEWYTGSCGGTHVGSGNNFLVTPSVTTTFYGRYEDGSPCTYVTSCEQVTVTVIPSPTAVITPGSSLEFCTGGSVQLTASGGTSYLWSTSSATATITALTAGAYTVTVTGANGCASTSSVAVTVDPVSAGGTLAGSTRVCPGTNSTLLTLSGYTGTVVKWQWTTNGTDWYDIASTSQQYTATGLTATTTYRAVVQSGACSAAYSGTAVVTVTTTGTWLGYVSSDWNDEQNWCGGIPTSTTDVNIPADAPNQPVIGLQNATCRDVTVAGGASVTVASTATFWIYGNAGGAGTFYANSSTVSYSGSGTQQMGAGTYYNLNLRNAGTKIFPAGTTYIGKNFTVSENAVADATTNSTTIEYDGNSAQNVAAINYYNLTFSSTGSKTFSTGTTGINGVFSISGSPAVNTSAANCTVEYKGSSAQTVQNITYNNITFSNTGVKTLPASLYVTGTWTNNGTVTTGTGTVHLTGTATQPVGGTTPTTFYNLSVENVNGISLSAGQTLNGTLTFSSGKIFLDAYDLLMGTSATISGSGSTKYVVADGAGALRQRVSNNATDVTFPVGTVSEYLPLKIKLTAGSTADDFKVRVGNGLNTAYDASDNPTGTAITNSAVLKTWFVKEGTSGGSNATLTAQWNAADEGLNFTRSLCDVAHYTGGLWVYSAFSAASGSDPYTQVISGITSFSPFGVFGGQSITCSVNQTSLCLGGSVTVNYAATGSTWNSGNTFTAQLSDINGDFTSAVNIGSVVSQVSGSITATIPANTPTGTGYLIRVISNNPSTTGNANGTALSADPASAGGTVSSEQTICGGTTPADLTLSGHTGDVVKWQKSSDASFTSPVDILVYTATLPGATIGTLNSSTYFRAVVESGSCSPANSASVLITVSGTTGNWLGTTSTDWNVSSNWCGGVIPTSTLDVSIPAGVTYMPLVGTAGGTCRNITVSSGATLTVDASSTLTVTGNLDNYGTVTVNAGTSTTSSGLVMNGNFTNRTGATFTSTGSYTRWSFTSANAQTLTNEGTITTPLTSLDVYNSGTSGLTLAGANGFVAGRVNLVYGTVHNSGKITIGNGGSSTAVIQRGITGSTFEAGGFDAPPSFNIGTGGLYLLYVEGSSAYSTGYEVPSGNTASYVSLYNTADVSLSSDLTIAGTLTFSSGTPKLRIGAHTLTLNGTITYTVPGEFYGGPSSNLTLNGATTVNTIINGLNNLVVNGNTTLGGGVTVSGKLTLSGGALANQTYLTMAGGTTISRSAGSLASSPTFAGTVNLEYTGSPPVTTGNEVPAASGVLNNLTTNPGGVVQNSSPGATVTLLNEAFSDLSNWTGDLGNSYNQYSSVVSANAGGTANEARYYWGSSSTTIYTAAIYRSVNTTGYSSVNIRWKQLVDNYDADSYPYTLKVQCAASSGGPWTDIYSLSPTGTGDIGPETQGSYNWTTNVGSTFYLRFYITGYTFGINYWYFDDLIVESAAVSMPSTVTVNGTLDLSGGTYTVGGNTLVLNGDKTGTNALIGGTTSNLSVGGTGSKLILSPVTGGLNNLTINRANGVRSNTGLTVYGVLNLQSANPNDTTGTLEMNADTLILGSSSTSAGTGDVTGIMKRTGMTANVLYTFGNPYNSMKFENIGTLPTTMYAKVATGKAPSWKTGAVKRVIECVQKGGVNSVAAISLHYRDSELNGNTESNLDYWTSYPAAADRGRSNYNTTQNWVVYENVAISAWPTSFGVMEVTLADGETDLVWNGSESTSWEDLLNWTPNGIPDQNKNITIPDASTTLYDPVVPDDAAVKSITIAESGIVNTTTASVLKVYGSGGAWINLGGTLNPGSSSLVDFMSEDATISGTTSFQSLKIEPAATLELEYDAYIRVAGAIENSGIFRADNENVTVEYNGTAQTVINPNSSPAGYHHLTLSSSGTKTMPSGALTVHGNFTLSGTASAEAAGAMTIGQNVTLGNGTTFTGSSYVHSVAGNWTNNGGTFTAGSGTVDFQGTAGQTLGGTAATTFNNLTVDNSSGITLARKITVEGTLTFTSGKMTTGTDTLCMGSSASVSGAGAGKYICGKMLWNIPAGAPSRDFHIGDAVYYTPVTVAFAGVTTPGTLLGTTTGTEHPDITGSGINALKSVNRYWSLSNASTVFTDYSATFTFVAEDVDPGAGTGTFIVSKWNGSSWSPATMGTRTSTTTQITGVTSFGDFADGEACVASSDPTSASATKTTICAGDTTTLSVSGGGGGTNEIIQWYAGSCGGANVGNGNGLVVSPAATTTYYGRYENGSSCAHNSACVSVTVTVSRKPADPVSASADASVICSGGSTALTLNGGGGGTGETVKWYTESCGGSLVGTGNDLSVSPTVTTTYYGRYENGAPCNYASACRSVQVTVYETPVVEWTGSLDNQCEINTHYPLSGATPSGGSYSGDGVTGSIFNASLAGVGSHTITYTYTTENGCTNTATSDINVYPRHTISGNFTYYNSAHTPLADNVTVGLYEYPGGNQVGTDFTISDPAGYYEFSYVCPGEYEIRAASTLSTEGSINTTDAAQANYWGAHPYAIEKVRFYAGDVTGSQIYINSTDALRIQRHFVFGTAFDRPDWSFWIAGETISSNTNPSASYPVVTVPNEQDLPLNIYGLCTGDFNRSFVPGSSKSASASLQMTDGGTVRAGSNEETALRIKMTRTSWIGAISMILNFPSDLLTIKDISVNAGVGQLDWTVNGDELRIGWNTRVPVMLPADTTLLTLRVKTSAGFREGAVAGVVLAHSPLNELADDQYEVIGDAVVKSDKLAAYATAVNEPPVQYGFFMSNYPNPFANVTTINYTLPFEGMVTLQVCTMLGTKVSAPVHELQTPGAHALQFKSGNLPSGIYIATLRINGEGLTLTRTIKIVINR